MNNDCYGQSQKPGKYEMESLRLEAVTISVGFDDLLDYTLAFNHAHFDNVIVVTSHEDHKTKAVALKHGCICVPTDLFKKNGRSFNKGAAINAGFGHWQYFGWRLHLDSDIVLPDKFRQTLFNHTYLEQCNLYGCDRIDIIGKDQINKLRQSFNELPQHRLRFLIDPIHDGRMTGPLGGRIVGQLEGYCPLGFFQLWHASTQRDYPYSLGSAAHDDSLFAASYPLKNRHLLPTIICYHICPAKPEWGQNWNGTRKMPRL